MHYTHIVDAYIHLYIHMHTHCLQVDKEHVPRENLEAIKPYTSQPSFTPNSLFATSPSTANLCEWILTVVEYNNLYTMLIQPKEDALRQAQENVNMAVERVRKEENISRSLLEEKMQLMGQFEVASAEKNKLVHAQDRAVCVYVFIFMYVCVCVYMYVCMYVCLYICIRVRLIEWRRIGKMNACMCVCVNVYFDME
jgi:hypothetical protein